MKRSSALFLLGAAGLLWLSAGLPDGGRFAVAAFGLELELLRVDALSRLYALGISLAAFLSLLFYSADSARGKFSLLLSAAFAVGLVYASNWPAVLFFSGALLLAQALPEEKSLPARFAGWLALAAGVLLRLAGGASIEACPLHAGGAWHFDSILIGLGLLSMSAMVPLHGWLKNSASALPGIFCSAAGLHLLLRTLPGAQPLVWWGAGAALYGAVFSLLENDFKRMLSYAFIGQAGFVVCAVGLDWPLGTQGAAAQSFCLLLAFPLLFFCAEASGKKRLSDPGRPSGLVFAAYAVGALSITGLPGLSGFTAQGMALKTVEENFGLWLLLRCVAIATFLSVGLKASWFVFLNGDGKTAAPSRARMSALGTAAALCLLLGLWPALLYGLLPQPADIEPFALAAALGALQMHLGTALVFSLAYRFLTPKAPAMIDVDWLWRKPLAVAGGFLLGDLARASARLDGFMRRGDSPERFAWRELTRTAALFLALFLAVVALA